MAVYEIFPITIEGTVQAFRYNNPHSILVVKSNGGDGGNRVWHLEGEPPAMLDRAGVPRDVFRPGDRIKLQVQRLRDGKAGGYWTIRTVITKNGRPFESHRCLSAADGCE